MGGSLEGWEGSIADCLLCWSLGEQGEKRSTGLVGSQQLWKGRDCDWGSVCVLSAPEASHHSCPEYGEEKAVSGKVDHQG